MKNTCKILALVLVVMTIVMSLSAITVSADEATHTFDCTTITFVSDKAKVSGAYDNYFSFEGTVTMRGSDSKGVTSVELDKSCKGSVTFTTAGPAKVTIAASSTGAGNNSFILLVDSEGNAVGDQVEVFETAFTEVVYEVSAAGTYKVVNPGTGRTTRVKTIVVEDIAVCDHQYADGVCTLCGEADPSVCQHINTSPATCTAPQKCLDCEAELEAALGHTAGAEPTCVDAQKCTVCGEVLEKALGHTLTFTNTLPTADAAGSIKAHCSVCEADIDFGALNAMTPGTYDFDAALLGSIAQGACYDGEVKIVGGVFACHLSAKYQNQSGRETKDTFYVDDMPVWTPSHRMHFGGQSELLKNEDVHTGGYKNFIQIVTTAETTITIYWGAGKTNREMAVYDMAGNRLYETDENPASNELSVSTLTVPAGAYLIGIYNPEDAESAGGNYLHRITFEVKAPHTHAFSDATCTEAPKCDCGATEGEALGHDYKDGKCTRCNAEDPDYVAPPVVEDEPKDEPKEEPAKMNFFQKIIAWIVNLFKSIFGIFKK